MQQSLYKISTTTKHCLFVFTAKPGPPADFTTSAVSDEEVALKWNEPSDDGGCEITNYIVEQREAMKFTYSKTGETSRREITAKRLREGIQYMFRVAAQNECGVGEFVELAHNVTPKSASGMYMPNI